MQIELTSVNPNIEATRAWPAVSLGELCSRIVLLCTTMLFNFFIVLLRIECYAVIHVHVPEHRSARQLIFMRTVGCDLSLGLPDSNGK